MIRMVSLKCPECGANLSIEKERDYCYCQYCGTKIILDNGSTTHTYRNIDEARIKEAELESALRMKEIEITEKNKAIKIKASIILGIIGSLLLILGFIGGEATGNPDSGIYMISFVGLFAFMAIAWIWIAGDNK